MAATGLGAADVRDDATREQVRRIAARYSAADFLKFDPAREPASSLQFKDKYEIWLDALIATYRGDVYGVRFGASYDDVLRRIRVMRPYPSPKKLGLDETFYATYAITHVIYTLNDYGKYRLSRSWLPQEYKYLRQNLSEAIEEEDPEMLGEFMDTLRAFGMSEKDAPIRAAVAFELSHQNADGSWGDLKSESLYDRYHSTWTAVDGLREYLFLDEQLRRPELMPIIGR
jgi:hypothetical protein